MYNHAPEHYICPFCQIAKGEKTELGNQEPDVIFRDAFLTASICAKWVRSNPGHVIIMPNEHTENIYDVSEEIGHKVFDFSKQVAVALKETYRCAGVSTRQHNEPAGNQDVWHYHVHVFPRYEGDNLYLNHNDTYWPTAEQKKPYADKLKNYFATKLKNS